MWCSPGNFQFVPVTNSHGDELWHAPFASTAQAEMVLRSACRMRIMLAIHMMPPSATHSHYFKHAHGCR